MPIECMHRQDDLKKIEQSEAEILGGFFHFYGYQFKENQNIICRNQGRFPKRSEVGKIFDMKHLSGTSYRYQQYLVGDPMNNTYNPAHLVRVDSIEARVYKNAFQEAFKRIIDV